MKIVINACYDGFFDLSRAGMMDYALRKGIVLYAWKIKPGSKPRTYVPYEAEDEEPFVTYYTTAPLVDGQMPDEIYFQSPEDKRDDPDLIAMVEELGEKSSTRVSNLKVIEIPDDVEWEIEEYDGYEHIAEKHRTWR